MKKFYAFALASIVLFACRKDPCRDILCVNGGSCVNGICDCPLGYSGPDCGTAMIPAKMIITKIVVNNFPLANNGAGWDFTSGPDLFLTVNSGTTGNENEFSTSYFYSDQNSVPVTFSDDLPVTCTSASTNYSISLWDYDYPDPADGIGGLYFVPNDFNSGFPATINLTGGVFDFTLYVEWVF